MLFGFFLSVVFPIDSYKWKGDCWRGDDPISAMNICNDLEVVHKVMKRMEFVWRVHRQV